MQREVGTARGASLTFLGVSTPTIPWFDFSLNNERKSGFLPPTAGIQNGIGFEVMTPFYWNIAPNYDATIAPRYMAQRGLQFLNQFRFLHAVRAGARRATRSCPRTSRSASGGTRPRWSVTPTS